MFGLGWPEIALILTIGLLLFGKRLPELARSLGKAMTEFRKEVHSVEEKVLGPDR